MHPRRGSRSGRTAGFPRRRGDAPFSRTESEIPGAFPPQARGCTHCPDCRREAGIVSPAGAGMHREPSGIPGPEQSFPRRRGDAPRFSSTNCRTWTFPPQARGCTPLVLRVALLLVVSPAGAGMHRAEGRAGRIVRRFPRRRGDAPLAPVQPGRTRQFPPQARGCTGGLYSERSRDYVSPAGAGMHPVGRRASLPRGRFPRRRGDAPPLAIPVFLPPPFPPQARGCTCDGARIGTSVTVSPAGAGMHPAAHRFPRR